MYRTDWSSEWEYNRYVHDADEFGVPPALNEYVIVVTMEKLHPVDKVFDGIDIVNFFRGLGIDLQQEHERRRQAGRLLLPDVHMYLLSFFNNERSRANIMKHTKNPKLKEALRLMELLFKKYVPDVHSGNVMFRLTNIGPQLVFTDPITGKD